MGILYRALARGSLLLLGCVSAAAAVPANSASYLSVETVSYEWMDDGAPATEAPEFAAPAAQGIALANFGPFRVVSEDRAEIIGSIESDAPRLFRRMLAAYPAIRNIEFIDCPGTGDDTANLEVARMIRRAGMATHVPAGGSARSGGVELFLAGAKRSADAGAEFAVHRWMDEDGLEADDYPPNDPVHQTYIAYYREMGMDDAHAHAFYALTNSAPFDHALYLGPQQIAAYLPLN